MSLFRYFSCEKVKAGVDHNNLEATKKDDDQSNATGVSKSTAELAVAQESSKKKISYVSRVVEDWKTLAGISCFVVIADSFRKINLHLEAKKVTTVFVLMGSKNMK